jgi:gamma-glutamyltranspeptidase
MFRQGGIAVGVAALGVLIPTAAGLGGDAHAFVSGLQDALLVGAGVAAAGAVAAWVLIRPRTQSRPAIADRTVPVAA